MYLQANTHSDRQGLERCFGTTSYVCDPVPAPVLCAAGVSFPPAPVLPGIPPVIPPVPPVLPVPTPGLPPILPTPIPPSTPLPPLTPPVPPLFPPSPTPPSCPPCLPGPIGALDLCDFFFQGSPIQIPIFECDSFANDSSSSSVALAVSSRTLNSLATLLSSYGCTSSVFVRYSQNESQIHDMTCLNVRLSV